MSLSPQLCPIASLVPYERNSRTHSDEQIAKLAASIDAFGLAGSIVVRAGTIAKGTGTLRAIRKILDAGGAIYPLPGRFADPAPEPFPAGMVPVQDATGWSDAQFRGYVIADNQLALEAGWDEGLLGLELGALQALDFDLGLTGFDPSAIARLIAATGATGGLTDPDEAPPVPDVPVSSRDDCWLLGNHRLVCGDSTDKASVDLALGGVRPHLMVTDPPYGVEYDASWRKARGINNGGAMGKVLNDDVADWRGAWALFPGDVVYCWHAGLRANSVFDSLVATGFEIRAQIIWAKNSLVMGRGHYHFQHEPCWYAVRKGSTGHWAGDRKQSTLWHIDKPQKSETGHSTQKPVECMKRPMENNSSPGQAVYEPFSGSGTTLIAAEMTARSCHAIELSPGYVDVAVRRWEAFTGKQAVHLDGRTFAEVAEARGKGAKAA